MKENIDKVLSHFLVLLMAIMVMAVTWQVFSRYVMQAPSSITEELSRFLLIWIGLLGAAYASGQQNHLAIDLLESKLNPLHKKRLKISINVLIIFFCITVLIIGGGNLVYVNFDLGQNSAALGVPLYIIYTVLPLSGVLVIAYKVNEILNSEKYLT
ncbi:MULTISPECIES: TRAP transporter small permease [Salegentibacter]|uniref:TRAP transporter small permease n=1 Tax=Salegentibacter maritimus TaxID=2794347 RepID=A0ABS0TKF2_9FLAO|nr:MULTISPECIES: TRAP transporter small permease [Salegentibacter]MBE7640555.1 TRAP transporter small permease subunit [Salegentibacter sp. BLCTC]MBI6115903.1 TRAP transporter small permease [Salegentibacter maritimus]MBI6121270.1 TRAP transporter small permease [Salegentibacter maritimus]